MAAAKKAGPIVRQQMYLVNGSACDDEEREHHDIHQKGGLREWVEMHLDPCDVAQDLEDQSTQHGSQVAPCLVPDAQVHLREDEEREDGEV